MRTKYVTAHEVAKFLNVAEVTLRKWRGRDYGPKSYTFGTAVRYDMSEVRAWAKQQTAQPVVDSGPIVVDAEEISHVLDLLDAIPRDSDDTPQDVIGRVTECTHGYWEQLPTGDGEYRLICTCCQVTPELAVALDLTAELDECGHELVDAEDWDLLETHVQSEEMGEGTFRSCDMEMPDWNTDQEDDPAQAA